MAAFIDQLVAMVTVCEICGRDNVINIVVGWQRMGVCAKIVG